jgi:hypothetical protein
VAPSTPKGGRSVMKSIEISAYMRCGIGRGRPLNLGGSTQLGHDPTRLGSGLGSRSLTQDPTWAGQPISLTHPNDPNDPSSFKNSKSHDFHYLCRFLVFLVIYSVFRWYGLEHSSPLLCLKSLKFRPKQRFN